VKRKKIFIILLIVGSLTLLVLGYKSVKVERIECQSQFGPCDEETNGALSAYEGKTLLVSYTGVRRELNNNLKVSHYTVKFLDPRTIQTRVTQRKPQVAVIAEGENKYHLYSKDGILLETEEETQLPVVRIMDISVITKEQMNFVIEMAHALNQTYNVNAIVIQQGGMEFEVTGSPKIIFPVQGDIDVLLGSLTFVLSQLNSQLGDFRMEFIDFRFKNPVIKVID
jgi:hypothetical protein